MTTPKPAAVRLYVIMQNTPATEDDVASDRPVALIKTTSAAAALRHYVAPKFVATLAGQEALYACAEAGIKPEVASSDE